MTLITNRRHSRFLVDLRAADLVGQSWESWMARTRQAATYTRANQKLCLDQNGVLYRTPYGFPALHWDPTLGSTLGPVLLLEASRKMAVLQSADFGTTWTPVGTPTRSAAAHTASGVTLDLIGDDDAAGLEGYYQAVVFTGDGVKAISLYVKQGTSPHTGIRLRDATAGTEKLRGTIQWSGGLPVLGIGAASSGTVIGYEALANGVFRVMFSSESITAANSNLLYVYPATTAGYGSTTTGDVYAGGVQGEDAAVPSSYFPNTSSRLTRAADVLTLTFAGLPRALTFLADIVEYGTLSTGASSRIFTLGGALTSRITAYNASGVFRLQQTTAVGVSSTAAAAPTFGQRTRLRGLLYADGSVTLGQTIASGSEVVAANGGADALASAWGNTSLEIGHVGGASQGFFGLRALRVAAGNQSQAYMEAA